MTVLNSPILITGPPHSGKSLLAKILSQSQQFYCFGEPLSLWNYGMPDGADDVRTETDATADIISEIRSGIEKILAREKKARYVDDFSYHALRVRFVGKVLPEAKVIMMVRDPADVIPEMMYFWRYRDPLSEAWKRHKNTISFSTLPILAKKFFVNYVSVRLRGRRKSWGPMTSSMIDAGEHQLAETVAFQWECLVRIGLDDLQNYMKDRSMVVRFEDMVLSPNSVVAEIAKFCEIDERDNIVGYASNVLDPSYRFEKRDQVDAQTSLKLDQKIRETRQRLGYKLRENWM